MSARLTCSFPLWGKAGMEAACALRSFVVAANAAGPHPCPGAGGETPPLFGVSRCALAQREPHPSAPAGEGVMQESA